MTMFTDFQRRAREAGKGLWSEIDRCEGYRTFNRPKDETFERRANWLRFRGQLGGLAYHGVNDVNTAGMMDFLNWRYRTDLQVAKTHLGE